MAQPRELQTPSPILLRYSRTSAYSPGPMSHVRWALDDFLRAPRARPMCTGIRLTLHPCSTRNTRAEDRSCMLCVGSGLGLLLLLVSMRGAGAGRAVAACSLCVWRRCGTSWRGCWLAIPLTGAGRCALRRIVDVNQRLESQTNQTQAIPHAKRTNIHPFMSIQLPTQARRPNLA